MGFSPFTLLLSALSFLISTNWSWRTEMFEMLTVKMLTLFIANLAYATKSSFHCGNSDTHFLSLRKVLILIPNLYTTQSRSKLQMIKSYVLSAYQNRTLGSYNGSWKRKSRILILYYNYLGIGTVDNYHQCLGIAPIFTSMLMWQMSGSETLNKKWLY